MDLLANLGGIFAGIIAVFKVAGKFINEKVIKAKINVFFKEDISNKNIAFLKEEHIVLVKANY